MDRCQNNRQPVAVKEGGAAGENESILKAAPRRCKATHSSLLFVFCRENNSTTTGWFFFLVGVWAYEDALSDWERRVVHHNFKWPKRNKKECSGKCPWISEATTLLCFPLCLVSKFFGSQFSHQRCRHSSNLLLVVRHITCRKCTPRAMFREGSGEGAWTRNLSWQVCCDMRAGVRCMVHGRAKNNKAYRINRGWRRFYWPDSCFNDMYHMKNE